MSLLAISGFARLVEPFDRQTHDLQRIQTRVLVVCQKDVITHKLDRRVAVPALRIRSNIPNVFPGCSFVFRNGGCEWAATDGLDGCQRIVAIILHQQQVACPSIE